MEGSGRACYSRKEATVRNRYSNRCGGIANDGSCLLGKSGDRIRLGLGVFLEEAVPGCAKQFFVSDLRGLLIGHTVVPDGSNGRGALYGGQRLTVLRDSYGIGIGTGSTGGVSGCSGNGCGISNVIDRQHHAGYQLGKLGVDVIADSILRCIILLAYGNSGSGIQNRLGVFQSGDIGILGYGHAHGRAGNGSGLVAVHQIVRVGNDYVVVRVTDSRGGDGAGGSRAHQLSAHVAVRGILVPRIGQGTAVGNGSNHAQRSGHCIQIVIGTGGSLGDYGSCRMNGRKTGDTCITREGDGAQGIRLGRTSVIITLSTIVHSEDIALIQSSPFRFVYIADRVRFQNRTGKNGKTEGHNGS